MCLIKRLKHFKNIMIIGVCGFTYTGSGAFLDLLKEFEEIRVLKDFEFNLAFFPDGLSDLEYHLNLNPVKYMSSDVAIERFERVNKNLYIRTLNKLTENQYERFLNDFLNEIIQVKWKGFGGTSVVLNKRSFSLRIITGINRRILRFADKFLKKNINIFPVRTMNFSMYVPDFVDNAKNLIKKTIEAWSKNSDKIIALDQPFPANSPEKAFKFFDNPKAIIVDRDPRDLYVSAKEVFLSKSRQIPTDNVYNFISYYRNMRKKDFLYKNSQDVLYVRFESLIYEYDKTVSEIQNFLNINKQTEKKNFFDPMVSINNTQVYKRYPKYNDDIKVIEKELEDYLFDFEKYDLKGNNGKIF